MSDVGKLCYKAGGSALCYKAGGSALVYKAVAPTDISLTLAFRPQTWVCYTYDSQHAGILNVNTLWDGANYSVTSSPYTITIPASYCKNGVSALQLTIATSDVCQAHEDPGVSVAFAATQNGTTIIDTTGGTILRKNFSR